MNFKIKLCQNIWKFIIKLAGVVHFTTLIWSSVIILHYKHQCSMLHWARDPTLTQDVTAAWCQASYRVTSRFNQKRSTGGSIDCIKSIVGSLIWRSFHILKQLMFTCLNFLMNMCKFTCATYVVMSLCDIDISDYGLTSRALSPVCKLCKEIKYDREGSIY